MRNTGDRGARRIESAALLVRSVAYGEADIIATFFTETDGKVSSIEHDGRGVFQGVSHPFVAGRYHSLVVAEPLPDVLEAAAHSEDGTIMGLRHRTFPVHGVQFHPESVLTDEGRRLLRNFLDL